jgi:hypothetical protein
MTSRIPTNTFTLNQTWYPRARAAWRLARDQRWWLWMLNTSSRVNTLRRSKKCFDASMKPEVSLPRSHEPVTLCIMSHLNPLYILPTNFFNILLISSSYLCPHILQVSHLYQACYMPCSSHSLWFCHLNIIWWKSQLRSSWLYTPVTSHIWSLRSRHSQHSVLFVYVLIKLRAVRGPRNYEEISEDSWNKIPVCYS